MSCKTCSNEILKRLDTMGSKTRTYNKMEEQKRLEKLQPLLSKKESEVIFVKPPVLREKKSKSFMENIEHIGRREITRSKTFMAGKNDKSFPFWLNNRENCKRGCLKEVTVNGVCYCN